MSNHEAIMTLVGFGLSVAGAVACTFALVQLLRHRMSNEGVILIVSVSGVALAISQWMLS